jgi:hypothetical protein
MDALETAQKRIKIRQVFELYPSAPQSQPPWVIGLDLPGPQGRKIFLIGKQIERCVISTFQVAESMSFKGESRQWWYTLIRSQVVHFKSIGDN